MVDDSSFQKWLQCTNKILWPYLTFIPSNILLFDWIKCFRFSSKSDVTDDYYNEIESNIHESDIYEKDFSNDSVVDEPTIPFDVFAMLPIPSIRRKGLLENRQSVRTQLWILSLLYQFLNFIQKYCRWCYSCSNMS